MILPNPFFVHISFVCQTSPLGQLGSQLDLNQYKMSWRLQLTRAVVS